jgi:hypothetical protein
MNTIVRTKTKEEPSGRNLGVNHLQGLLRQRIPFLASFSQIHPPLPQKRKEKNTSYLVLGSLFVAGTMMFAGRVQSIVKLLCEAKYLRCLGRIAHCAWPLPLGPVYFAWEPSALLIFQWYRGHCPILPCSGP